MCPTPHYPSLPPPPPALAQAWGLVSAACAAMSGPASFYALRLALGLTEAGAFPGMWYVAGCFYPHDYITLPYSLIEASIAISQILAAPLAAGLLRLGGLGGLAGWRWLFLVQGGATLGLAAVLRARLPDSPATAPFLNEEDRAWLLQQLRPVGGAGAGAVPCHEQCTTQGAKQLPVVEVSRQDAGAGHAEERVCGSVSPSDTSDAVALLADAGTTWHSDAPRKQHHLDAEGGNSSSSSWGSPPGKGTSQQQPHQQQQYGGCSPPASPPLSWRCQLAGVLCCRSLLYLMALKALKDISLDALVYCECLGGGGAAGVGGGGGGEGGGARGQASAAGRQRGGQGGLDVLLCFCCWRCSCLVSSAVNQCLDVSWLGISLSASHTASTRCCMGAISQLWWPLLHHLRALQ